jgi:polar amino acid transport system substrate-binding protein
MLTPLRALAAALVPALCALPVQAGCSRPITVPLAPVGISVIVKDDQLSGIYPTLLRKLGARTGCQLKMTAVPQARLEAMFEMGTADLMLPAMGTAHRDRFGEFVPLVGARAMLLSVDAGRPAVADLKALLLRRELRVAVVRGNDYGEAYRAALAELERQGRLFYETDPLRVARLLDKGMADVTILTPMSLAYEMKADPRVRHLLQRLRIEEMPELPWGYSGAYLSTRSLSPQDRRYLAVQLREDFKTDAVWAEYRRYYPANVVAASRKPR